ncbi:trimeric intracellular cation channel family protein [Calidifontibacter sp. DB0510]|uniref:Trimeric intracellular cation channel family protein n=1 Tax=Metallococcus carri TaxID=1656884 RepID=A0A967B9H8_9MICO|nr:TRIC cation channel family protein [Metallococcus carri]NHN57326.1 trimeric intracellular cation channel family protein [Metallococcus carri]NOP38069.1 trimeric intracellular cation channel family protein [Calidifontibacter sp. DB2511S]
MSSIDPSAFFNVVDVTGVVANGLLGGAVARAYRFDAVGFAMLGIVSGLGGGVIRDVLLGNGFPVALTNPAYLSGALIASAAAYLLVLGGKWTGRLLILADLLAVGCWAATGTVKSLAVGLGPLACVLIGVLTAIGGGILRDVLVAKIPAVFGDGPLYATIALIGAIEMFVLARFDLPNWGMTASIVTCAGLGLLARRRGWRLPGAAQWEVRLPARYAGTLRRPGTRQRH